VDVRKHAIILSTIEELNRRGSWTGKTHVQKALSLVNSRGKIKLPFQFVLYKHGPYSFDVEDEIEQMKGYAAIESEPIPGFGVTLSHGQMAEYVRSRCTLEPQATNEIKAICKFVANRNVMELERLATAAWIRSVEKISEHERVARRLNELKPHITVDEAKSADAEVSQLLSAGK
jgi:uncharacterized protein YwgA